MIRRYSDYELQKLHVRANELRSLVTQMNKPPELTYTDYVDLINCLEALMIITKEVREK